MSEPNRPAKLKLWPLALGAVAIAGLAVAVSQAPAPPSMPKSMAPDEGVLTAQLDGTVKSVVVKPGDEIHEEDVLIYFDDSAQVTAYEQAQNELQQIASKVKTGDVAVALPAEERIAGTLVGNPTPPPSGPAPRPKGPVTQLPSVGGSVSESTAPVQPIVRGVDDSAKKEAQARLDASNAALVDLRRQRDQAVDEAAQSERSIPELERQITVTRQEADKQRMLLQQGAVPANASARADAAHMQAQGALQITKNKVDEAKSRVNSLEAQIATANIELKAAESAYAQASIVEVSAPPTRIGSGRPLATSRPRPSAPARVVAVRKAAPPAEPTRVVVDYSKKSELDSALDGAKAKVDAAEEALIARRAAAPKGLKVLEVLVKPGDQVRFGQPIAKWKHVPALDAPPLVIWHEQITGIFHKLFSF